MGSIPVTVVFEPIASGLQRASMAYARGRHQECRSLAVLICMYDELAGTLRLCLGALTFRNSYLTTASCGCDARFMRA